MAKIFGLSLLVLLLCFIMIERCDGPAVCDLGVLSIVLYVQNVGQTHIESIGITD